MLLEIEIRRLAREKNLSSRERPTLELALDYDFIKAHFGKPIFIIPDSIDEYYHKLYASLRLNSIKNELIIRKLKGDPDTSLPFAKNSVKIVKK